MYRETPINAICLDWQESTARSTFERACYPVHKAGVYLYTTINKYPLYVGRTEDLEKRFEEHLSDTEPNKDLWYHLNNQYTRLYYAELPEENLREGVELFLFNYLSPAFNKKTPDAIKEISVNLPDGVNYERPR